MKYVVFVFILLPVLYTLSYAKYCWVKKNKSASIGSILLAAAAILTPLIYMIWTSMQ